MAGKLVAKIVKIMLLAVLFVILFGIFGYVVMRLWNWLMPALFGLHVIGYWQAIGLMVLSKILFGGFHRGRHGGSRRWRRRMSERWGRMTPEEREKFRESMRGRCGSFAPSAAEPKA
jgi:H+/Cl- antiporter ClcA